MVEKNDKKRKMIILLIQESIWKIEDKLNVIVKSLATHRAELIRHERLIRKILKHLDKLNGKSKKTKKGGQQ